LSFDSLDFTSDYLGEKVKKIFDSSRKLGRESIKEKGDAGAAECWRKSASERSPGALRSRGQRWCWSRAWAQKVAKKGLRKRSQ